MTFLVVNVQDSFMTIRYAKMYQIRKVKAVFKDTISIRLHQNEKKICFAKDTIGKVKRQAIFQQTRVAKIKKIEILSVVKNVKQPDNPYIAKQS